MKKELSLIFILVILFLACTGNDNLDRLNSIRELLAKDKVDLANSELSNINAKKLLGEFEYNYYNILKVQILSRQYEDIPEEILDSCINYYEKVHNYPFLGESYYYKGGMLYDANKVSDGIVCFKRAEEIVRNYVKEDSQLLYKIYESLAFCNFESENYQMSLKYSKRCSLLSKYMKSPERYLFSKYYESVNYAKLNKQDSADNCINEYMPYIKYGSKEEQSCCYAEVAAYYLRQKDTIQAHSFIEKALEYGEDPVVCGIAGMIYRETNNNAKAEYMYGRAIKLSVSIKHKISSYHGLGLVMSAQKKYELAALCFNKESELQSSLTQKNQDEGAKDIQYEFDIDNTNNANSRKLSIMSCVCIFFGFLLVLTAVGALIANSRKNIKLRQVGSNLEKSANEIVALQKLNGDNCKELERLKHTMAKEIETYMKQLSQGRRLYEGLALGRFIEKRDSKAMKSLLAYYRIVDPDFFASLEEEYDELTVQSQLILMLRHIGKDDDDIANMLGVGGSSMRSYKYRIKKCHKCH